MFATIDPWSTIAIVGAVILLVAVIMLLTSIDDDSKFKVLTFDEYLDQKGIKLRKVQVQQEEQVPTPSKPPVIILPSSEPEARPEPNKTEPPKPEKKEKKSRVRFDTGIPSDRAELTQYIKASFPVIKKCKDQGPKRMASWLDSLGRAILEHSILTERLSVEEKFAAQYVVNRYWKKTNDPRGEKNKTFICRTIIVYHNDECHIALKKKGKYRGTYEVTYDIWCTHMPKKLVDEGRLERKGKPSAKGKLGKKTN